MLEAMIAGERDPQVLAGCARGPMKSKHAALAKAFTGMQFGPDPDGVVTFRTAETRPGWALPAPRGGGVPAAGS